MITLRTIPRLCPGCAKPIAMHMNRFGEFVSCRELIERDERPIERRVDVDPRD